jgi:lysophospholipase L1-like esterase
VVPRRDRVARCRPCPTAGKHIILVDNYAAFSANPSYQTALMADTLHPNPAGYALLGQTWYAAIQSFVPMGP